MDGLVGGFPKNVETDYLDTRQCSNLVSGRRQEQLTPFRLFFLLDQDVFWELLLCSSCIVVLATYIVLQMPVDAAMLREKDC